MNPEIVVAGHLCLDVIPRFLGGSKGLKPGRLVEVGDCVFATGGVVSNTGLALHKLGVPVRLVGKIGDDTFGGLVKSVIDSYGEGLSDGLVVAKGESTSYSVVISPVDEDRMFLHSPGVNDTFCADDISDECLVGAKHFHFGYPTLMKRMHEDEGAQLLAIMKKAKAAGLTTSLDVSFPDPDSPAGGVDWRELLTKVLPYVDLFVPSVEELMFMIRWNDWFRLNTRGSVRNESIQGLANEGVDLGAKATMVKASRRGLFLKTSDKFEDPRWCDKKMRQKAFQVEAMGTTGAGDAAVAGFLMGFVRGFTPEKALEAAAAVGACSCEKAEAVTGVMPWPETAARIYAGWELITQI